MNQKASATLGLCLLLAVAVAVTLCSIDLTDSPRASVTDAEEAGISRDVESTEVVEGAGRTREEAPRDPVPAVDRDLVRAERAARLSAFLQACHGVVDYGSLSDPYLGNIDVEGLLKAVRQSGLQCEDIRLGLAESGLLVVPPKRRGAVLLAMAFAPGFGDPDAGFLVSLVVGNPGAFDGSATEATDEEALLASTHALRLRGRLHEALVPGLREALDRGWQKRNGQPFLGATACLLELLSQEACAGDANAEALAIAEELVTRPRLTSGKTATAVELLLQANEDAMVARLHAALEEGGNRTVATAGLPLLSDAKHVPFLESVVARSQRDNSLESAAEGAVLGLLASARVKAVDTAAAWLQSPKGVNLTQLQALATAVPVDVALRCCAVLSGRYEPDSVPQRLRDAIVQKTERRLDVLRLSPFQRARLFRELEDLFAAQTLTPEGRLFCLRQMGRIGAAEDRERIQQVGAMHHLEGEASNAIHDIQERMQRRLD